MTFFVVYKVTNKLNGRYYIGKHQTEKLNDSYLGSGFLLINDIREWGYKNFEKEILHIFDNKDDMEAKEKELIVISDETYNIRSEGAGIMRPRPYKPKPIDYSEDSIRVWKHKNENLTYNGRKQINSRKFLKIANIA